MTPSEIDAYLADCRQLTLQEIQDIIPRQQRYRSILYDLMLEYPLRNAKALRPALCIAACRGLGGPLEGVLRSAATLELYHNAFLIHDDVEDGSESRRDRPTLHWTHGMPIAVNVGDAMLALARIDDRQCRLVELRYFGGLSIEETAQRILRTVDSRKAEAASAKAT